MSDTHGNLDTINELAEKTQANAIIHAGDFGFYDHESFRRISARELFLLISHSPIWKEYNVSKQTNRDVLIDIVKQHKLLGDFCDYLSGDKKFIVPVFAVWGNHEDVTVIKKLTADCEVENLNMLTSEYCYQLCDNSVALFGLGGNFLIGGKLLDNPIAGHAGKVWSTLHEFGTLYKIIKQKTKPSIFVSHVSPGKEPLLTRLISHFMPNFWISGHMGAPFTCVWNQFTIREMNESLEWFKTELPLINEVLKNKNLTEEVQLALELINREIPRKDYWFKQMWNINLPDAKDGYAVITIENGRFSLETYSRGIIL